MAHYGAGDNYGRGDYYRGDLFGFLKKAIGTVTKFIPGVSEVVGAAQTAVGLAQGLVKHGGHPNLPQPKLSLTQVPSVQTGVVNIGGTGPQTGLINLAGAPSPSLGLPPGLRQRGYHPNKSTYETRGGGTSRWPQELELHRKGEVLVRNRRMNVGNARALKRALRRAHGFERLARRVMHVRHTFKKAKKKK